MTMSPLSESQKYTLLRLLKDLASADRNIDFAEVTRIRILGLKLDLTPEKIGEAIAEDYTPVTEHLQHFTQPDHQRFVYQQCLLLLLADRSYEAVEQEALAPVREAFEISNEFHQRAMKWVHEGLDWEKRGLEMAGGGFSE